MSYRELARLLTDNGCKYVRPAKGSHEWWWSPITNQHFSVPCNLKGEGTLHAILRQAGVKRPR